MKEETNVQSVFELLWTDDERNNPRILTFLTQPVGAAVAKGLVDIIGQINDFIPERVCRAIDKCPPDCHFEIGREYSPVIYVQVSYKRDTDQDKLAVIAAFVDAYPDEKPELECVEYDGVTICSFPNRLRFWWD